MKLTLNAPAYCNVTCLSGTEDIRLYFKLATNTTRAQLWRVIRLYNIKNAARVVVCIQPCNAECKLVQSTVSSREPEFVHRAQPRLHRIQYPRALVFRKLPRLIRTLEHVRIK